MLSVKEVGQIWRIILDVLIRLEIYRVAVLGTQANTAGTNEKTA
jgi:hypothetical protein